MATELYDEEGNPVQAVTPDEAAAQAAEAAEAAKAEAKVEFEKTLADKEEELEAAKKKDANFAALRTKTQTQEEQAAAAKAEVEALKKEIAEAKDSGKNYAINSTRDKAIKQMAGGDVELEKKLRANYEVINRPTDNEDQVLARVRDAYLLSVDPVPNSGGGSNYAPSVTSKRVGGSAAQEVSSELKQFGASKFGLSDEDFKNFGK